MASVKLRRVCLLACAPNKVGQLFNRPIRSPLKLIARKYLGISMARATGSRAVACSSFTRVRKMIAADGQAELHGRRNRKYLRYVRKEGPARLNFGQEMESRAVDAH